MDAWACFWTPNSIDLCLSLFQYHTVSVGAAFSEFETGQYESPTLFFFYRIFWAIWSPCNSILILGSAFLLLEEKAIRTR